MKTNLHALHEVYERRAKGFFPRQTGKTFARCHEIAGFVALGEPHIYCEIACYHDLAYIFPMLRKVLVEHGLSCSRIRETRLQSQNTQIQFIPSRDWAYRTAGCRGIRVPMKHTD